MYASIVLDIPTRALDSAFDYKVPEDMENDLQVGCTVLVNFANRAAVGYVVDVLDSPSTAIDSSKIKPIKQVLASSAFDKELADLAFWMSEEYAATISDCIRLLLAPGQKVKVQKNMDGKWELVSSKAKPLDMRVVSLTEEGKLYVPARNASRQREVVQALLEGPLKMSELRAMIDGAPSVVKALEKKHVVDIAIRREIRGVETTTLSSAQAIRPHSLTTDQINALKVISHTLSEAGGSTTLIDGVTGSGKTEVYLCAIEDVLKEGKSAIVLVPEISLTAQTVGRFRSRFGDSVAVIHSKLSVGERYDQWDMVRQGKARVLVGARSALFAPMKNLGLIVIDEEHESSYKQDQSPRYHAREVALQLAKIRNCSMILGSATPSLESQYRCKQSVYRNTSWKRVEMSERPGDAHLPEVEIVDMTNQFVNGNNSVFSKPLTSAIEEVVEKRQKAVLLLNRRGFANFLMCRECGCVPECPHCSTALTYHESTHTLECHSCGRHWSVCAYPNPATKCPNCGSKYLAKYGVGTQRVESELRMLVGDRADIIRMDWDTTRFKGAHQKLLEEFDTSECAILVGTQMIAKGLDFPEVTLAGVINADTTLKLPDFRAAETTYNLLEQVAGRAGRGSVQGRVIIQTYWATHPAIQAVKNHNRDLYIENELEDREEVFYPPYSRLSNVLFWGSSQRQVENRANLFAEQIRKRIIDKPDWQVLGPVDCVKAKIQDKYRFHILIKSPLDSDVGSVLQDCYKELGSVRSVKVAIDVDAYNTM